jgi:hypothetical protein
MAMLFHSDVTNWFAVRGGLLRGMALSMLAFVCGGCTGIQRCATWDHVTHPDYMYPEETLLHGFHRTTWEAWPAHGFQGMWMKEIHSGEPVPTGKPSRELTPPAEVVPDMAPTPTMPDSPNEGYVPQARHPQAPPRGKGKSRPTTPAKSGRTLAEVFHGAAELEEEMVAPTPAMIEETVAAPDMIAIKEESEAVAAADAQWTGRFAAMIARDRKRAWRELDSDASPVEIALDESAEAPAVIEPMSYHAEEPAAAIEVAQPSQIVPATEVRLHPTPAATPRDGAASPETPAPREGKAEVRWKASSSK